MSQRPTVPTTKSGTSESVSPKKEHWKTKQKREREAAAKHPGGGNPEFRLTPEQERAAVQSFIGQEPDFETLVAAEEAQNAPRRTVEPAITNEDIELDRMLEMQARTQTIENGPDRPLKQESVKRDILRNFTEDYKPASTLLELEDQIHQAKMNDIDSIEATPALVRHLWKKDFEHIKNETGYGIYKDIRVYIDGFFEQNKNADKVTMEQRLFSGGQKIDIGPIITPQKV